MKNFQKMLLVFISTALLAGCQDGSQQESESQNVNTQEELQDESLQGVSELDLLDKAQDIDEEMNDLFSFLIPTAQAESEPEKEYKNLSSEIDVVHTKAQLLLSEIIRKQILQQC
jgi:hypothetical protein